MYIDSYMYTGIRLFEICKVKVTDNSYPINISTQDKINIISIDSFEQKNNIVNGYIDIQPPSYIVTNDIEQKIVYY